jgi:hypothetical protein
MTIKSKCTDAVDLLAQVLVVGVVRGIVRGVVGGVVRGIVLVPRVGNKLCYRLR